MIDLFYAGLGVFVLLLGVTGWFVIDSLSGGDEFAFGVAQCRAAVVALDTLIGCLLLAKAVQGGPTTMIIFVVASIAGTALATASSVMYSGARRRRLLETWRRGGKLPPRVDVRVIRAYSESHE